MASDKLLLGATLQTKSAFDNWVSLLRKCFKLFIVEKLDSFDTDGEGNFSRTERYCLQPQLKFFQGKTNFVH